MGISDAEAMEKLKTIGRMPASTAPFADLQEISLVDLQLIEKHHGQYVLVRLSHVAPMIKDDVQALSCRMQDQKGGEGTLYLPNPDVKRPFAHSIRDGSAAIVKEPFSASEPQRESWMIRVDHVSDVIFLEPEDERVPAEWRTEDVQNSVEEWKAQADKCYIAGKLDEALYCYTRAFGKDNDNDSEEVKKLRAAMQLNRSQVYLTLGYHEKALADAEAVATLFPKNELARVKAALALYKARRFEDCNRHLSKLLEEFPENKMGAKLKTKCNRRVEEGRTGNYDWVEMKAAVNKASRSKPADLDYADFIGPVRIGLGQETTTPPGKEGLFATRDVKAGELLLFVKAFAIVASGELNQAKLMEMKISTTDFKPEIISRLSRNPEQSKAFLNNHTPKEYTNPGIQHVDGRLVIDSHQIEELILGQPPWHMYHDLYEDPYKSQQRINGVGLWTTPSHANHSCYHAGQRSFIGDFMILRATRDLKEGDEVTIGFRNPAGGYKERTAALSDYGIKCVCSICKAEEDESPAVHSKRKRLFDSVCAMAGVTQQNTTKIEKLIDELEATYTNPTNLQPRIVLADTLQKQLEFLAQWQHKQMTRGVEVPKALLHANVLRWMAALDFKIEVTYGSKDVIENVTVVKNGLFVNENVAESMAFMAKRAQTAGMQASCREVAKGFYEIIAGERESCVETLKKYIGSW